MDFQKVQRDIGIKFCDEKLIIQALTHSSCLNEPLGYQKSNEPLAWLGDALINWIVSENIFNPDITKKELTDIRKMYVNKEFLAGLSKQYFLDEGLIMTWGEEREGGRNNIKNLHTVFEAIVGAIFMDQGFYIARQFILEKCVHGQLVN